MRAGCSPHGSKWMLYEKAPVSGLLQVPHSDQVCLCIGPEGGWALEEVAVAREAGYHVFSLGGRILRSETAAIASVSIVQFLAGRRRDDEISPPTRLPEQGRE